MTKSSQLAKKKIFCLSSPRSKKQCWASLPLSCSLCLRELFSSWKHAFARMSSLRKWKCIRMWSIKTLITWSWKDSFPILTPMKGILDILYWARMKQGTGTSWHSCAAHTVLLQWLSDYYPLQVIMRKMFLSVLPGVVPLTFSQAMQKHPSFCCIPGYLFVPQLRQELSPGNTQTSSGTGG